MQRVAVTLKQKIAIDITHIFGVIILFDLLFSSHFMEQINPFFNYQHSYENLMHNDSVTAKNFDTKL